MPYKYRSCEMDFKLYECLALGNLNSIKVPENGPAKEVCPSGLAHAGPGDHCFIRTRGRMASHLQKRHCQKLRSF